MYESSLIFQSKKKLTYFFKSHKSKLQGSGVAGHTVGFKLVYKHLQALEISRTCNKQVCVQTKTAQFTTVKKKHEKKNYQNYNCIVLCQL